jgi:hypothetical protein
MTIVLDCFARDAAFQVSDRRLSDPDRPGIIIDDETNKAVLVNGRVIFSYTGLAAIDGQRTDEWLARAIADGPTEDMAAVAQRVRDKATAAFRRIRLPSRYKRHAFRGTGWFRLKNEDWLSPGLITVHNAFDHETGGWLNDSLPEFRVASYFPSKLPGGCFIRNVGVTPSERERDAIVRLVRKCATHRNATTSTVLDALVMVVQWLSKHRQYERIGPGLMVVCLPRSSVEKSDDRTFTFSAGKPNDSTPTFFYVPAKGATPITFGPIFVVGQQILTGFEAGYL